MLIFYVFIQLIANNLVFQIKLVQYLLLITLKIIFYIYPIFYLSGIFTLFIKWL